MKLQAIRMNCQQSIVLNMDYPKNELPHITNCCLATVNHNSKRIYVRIPWHVEKTLPEQLLNIFPQYEIVTRKTDSFSITMWTNDGDKFVS